MTTNQIAEVGQGNAASWGPALTSAGKRDEPATTVHNRSPRVATATEQLAACGLGDQGN